MVLGWRMVRSARVLLFSTARTAVGRAELDWPVPEDGIPAGSLTLDLAAAYPAIAPVLRASRFVLNGRYLTRLTVRVREGDEFAVHPPYGGG
jgi:molybdopterin converting factor small subunit